MRAMNNEQLKEMFRHRDNLMRIVSEETNIAPVAIMSKLRLREVVQARQIIMWAMIRKHGYSTMQIGTALGRTHGTIWHGLRCIDDALSINAPYTREIKRICEIIKNQTT